MKRRVPHALIVDADKSIRQTLRLHLELAGFAVEDVADGRAGLERLNAAAFDAVLADAEPAAVDGLTFCRAVRASRLNSDAALVIVSARDAESDKVLMLSSGADDYVTKPFGVRELLARVDAILRRVHRARGASLADRHTATLLSLNVASRETFVRGRRVELTRQEFDVLHQLVERPGTVFSRAVLLERVWSGDGAASERTVDVAISRLRRKIEVDPHDPQLILTSWGVGYKASATCCDRYGIGDWGSGIGDRKSLVPDPDP